MTITTASDHTVTTNPNGPLALWRERPDSEPAPAPEPASRPWLNPGPRSTDWYRRACRLAAERRRNIEAMRDELAEQLHRAYQSQDPNLPDEPGPSSAPPPPAAHAGVDPADPDHEIDPDPPPF